MQRVETRLFSSVFVSRTGSGCENALHYSLQIGEDAAISVFLGLDSLYTVL